ncbi:MAG: histidinol-phosphate transaminase [Candidatus Nitrosocosmicus sp.]|nr:histidinol-phosphate transaminase [Candidatus Nitrosocosmicus sp.]
MTLLQGCHHGGIYSANNLKYIKIDFSSNINPLGTSKKVISKLSGKTIMDLAYNYPDPKCINLKKRIVDSILCDNSFNPSDNLIVGNGATELIHYFADTFARRKNVGIPIPTFCEYELAAKRKNGKIKYFAPYNEDINFRIDYESIVRAANDPNHELGCLFLCNPNNPTGGYFEDEILKILEKTSKKTKILLDESFIEFVNSNNINKKKDTNLFIRLTKDYDNLVVLRSLTKIYGLAGLRVGYAVSSKQLIDNLTNNLISWNVNAVAQYAAIESIKDKSHLQKTISNNTFERNRLYKLLSKIKRLRVLPTHTNFYLLEVLDRINSTELYNLLLKKYGILVRDCTSFTGMNNKFIRVAIKTKKENNLLFKALEEIF